MGRDGTGWDRMGQDENRALETAAKGYSRAVRLMITWSIVFFWQLFFFVGVCHGKTFICHRFQHGHMVIFLQLTGSPERPINWSLTRSQRCWHGPGMCLEKHGLNHIHIGPLWCIDHLPSGLHIHERVNPWSPHHLLCGIEDLVRQQQWLIRNCKVRMWLGAPDGNNAKEMMFLPGRRPSLRWTNI